MSEPKWIASGTMARFGLADPGSTRLTFTLTLSADEWRALMRELPVDGCSQALGMMIRTMLGELTERMNTTYETTGWSGARAVEP